jgi:hypothetical protein
LGTFSQGDRQQALLAADPALSHVERGLIAEEVVGNQFQTVVETAHGPGGDLHHLVQAQGQGCDALVLRQFL